MIYHRYVELKVGRSGSTFSETRVPAKFGSRRAGRVLFLRAMDTGHFDTSRNVSTRGHAFKLNHTYARLDCRKHSFAVRTVAPWNALPQKVVESRKLIHFREALQETSDTLQRFLSGAVI